MNRPRLFQTPLRRCSPSVVSRLPSPAHPVSNASHNTRGPSELVPDVIAPRRGQGAGSGPVKATRLPLARRARDPASRDFNGRYVPLAGSSTLICIPVSLHRCCEKDLASHGAPLADQGVGETAQRKWELGPLLNRMDLFLETQTVEAAPESWVRPLFVDSAAKWRHLCPQGN